MRLYFVLLHILGPLARLIFGVRYVGTEHIPRSGPLIVCCNHRSVIDPLLLAVPFRRQVRYMAKSELFTDHGRLAAWFLRKVGAFPVQRDKGDASSVRTALDLLESGGVLGLFPEGRVLFENAPFRPKAGFALLAEKSRATVLPVSLYCEGELLRFRSRVTLRFGAPLSAEELFGGETGRGSVRRAAARLTEEINRMLEEKH
mgnify:CR=1 FL=1